MRCLLFTQEGTVQNMIEQIDPSAKFHDQVDVLRILVGLVNFDYIRVFNVCDNLYLVFQQALVLNRFFLE
jgi:hypothetical protein